ncbi:MAG: UDP-N-acetylmuramoyl-L-alanine--D-glutamate ligase [Candidatus Eisenbacteria bacterium]|nr:UDP-N-acetylmuramoyl-L-alanine--D-glutamate ligase [Candidatus Eisenbacteria bacterium]
MGRVTGRHPLLDHRGALRAAGALDAEAAVVLNRPRGSGERAAPGTGQRRRGNVSSFDPKGKRIVVLGLARSGVAAARLLADAGASVVATDLRDADALGIDEDQWSRLGIELVLGSHPETLLDGADLLVTSPGVPSDTPLTVAARERGVEIIGELELAWRMSEARWIAITGTNGKTTTTALTGELVGTLGRPTVVAGNIGVPVSGEVRNVPRGGFVVAEVSSFQLDTIRDFRPVVAACLNITPDHLDRYDSMDDYAASKARIFMNQREDDVAILNADDPRTAALADGIRSRVLYVSSAREVEHGAFVRSGTVVLRMDGRETEVTAAGDLGITGPHNLANALAALMSAAAVGVEAGPAAQVLRGFRPLEHRMEPVGERGGVLFVNDSKATNIESARCALASFDRPIVLIAGGRDKGSDFTGIRDLVADRVKHLVLIGEAADAIEKALGGEAPLSRAATMQDAVERATDAADDGDVVLLSPACASFDMFDDFEHRGRAFKDAVRALRAERETA